MILTSWVGEDSLISFRVVDNFAHGFGLRWNVNERVQSYTNPLWTLIHIPLYALTGNIILSACLSSWACLIGTLIFVRDTFSFSPLRCAALFVVPLLVAPQYAPYFTSGLEMPILNFLFACFGFVLIRRPANFWFWCSFVTSLAAFTRLDIVIVYAPIWVYLLYTERASIRWKKIITGSLPLAGWMCFSLFYYGFVLPNTALAKLGGHLPVYDYICSGLHYTYDFVLADPFSTISIVCVIIYSLYCAWKSRANPSPETSQAAMIACGILLYCLYVVYIGGDQFSVRMFIIPAFMSYWLWLWRFPLKTYVGYAGFVIMLILVQTLMSVPPELRWQDPIVKDAKIATLPWAHFMFSKSGPAIWDYKLESADMAVEPDRIPHEFKITINNVIGNLGYYGGPYQIVIDPVALSDPLLARLPAVDPHLIKMGDVWRFIPPGYDQANLTGSTKDLPAPLAQYYDKILLITRGKLWDFERLKTILLFNFGAYNKLRDKYIHDFYPRKLD